MSIHMFLWRNTKKYYPETQSSVLDLWIALIVFLFLHKNICSEYSLEAPQWGASNEYPQHVFVEKYKPDTQSCLDLWIVLIFFLFLHLKTYVVGTH